MRTLSAATRHDVDDVLGREVFDHLDHHEAAERVVGQRAQVFDGPTFVGAQAALTGRLDERGLDFDAHRVDTEVAEQLEELAASEADVEHRIAPHELLGDTAVPVVHVDFVAAEVRGERVGAVPRVDRDSRDPGGDVLDARGHVVELALLFGEAHAEVVELLQHALVVFVGEQVRDVAEQRHRGAELGVTALAPGRGRLGSGGRPPWRSAGARPRRRGCDWW